MAKPDDLLQGTLDMLILKAVSLGPLHGYGVLLRIQQISGERLQIQQGSLYPALYRLEHQGLIASEWGESDNKRKAQVLLADRRRPPPLQRGNPRTGTAWQTSSPASLKAPPGGAYERPGPAPIVDARATLGRSSLERRCSDEMAAPHRAVRRRSRSQRRLCRARRAARRARSSAASRPQGRMPRSCSACACSTSCAQTCAMPAPAAPVAGVHARGGPVARRSASARTRRSSALSTSCC